MLPPGVTSPGGSAGEGAGGTSSPGPGYSSLQSVLCVLRRHQSEGKDEGT